MAKRVQNHNLNEIRSRFQSLQAKANARAEALQAAGIAEYSRAFNEAADKMGAYRSNDAYLFDVNDTQRYREIRREVERMNKFLNDETSTVEGVQKMIAAEKYKGAFSGGWYKKYGVSYDKSRIDEDRAKIAFSIYRRLEESGDSREKIIGDLGYGSESLIMQIYDMVVESGIENDDSVQYWAEYGDILEETSRRLDDLYIRKYNKAHDIMEDGDEDSKSLIDNIIRNRSAWDFFNF